MRKRTHTYTHTHITLTYRTHLVFIHTFILHTPKWWVHCTCETKRRLFFCENIPLRLVTFSCVVASMMWKAAACAFTRAGSVYSAASNNKKQFSVHSWRWQYTSVPNRKLEMHHFHSFCVYVIDYKCIFRVRRKSILFVIDPFPFLSITILQFYKYGIYTELIGFSIAEQFSIFYYTCIDFFNFSVHCVSR